MPVEPGPHACGPASTVLASSSARCMRRSSRSKRKCTTRWTVKSEAAAAGPAPSVAGRSA